MALNYGPTIVTDGLVLALDAADINSYPGTGTTWYDTAGSGTAGSISNTTITSGTGLTTFTFSNTLGMVSMTKSPPTGSLTLEYWIRLESNPNTGGNNNWRFLYNQGFGGSFLHIVEENSAINFTVFKSGTYRTIGGTFTQAVLTIGQWTHLVYTYNQSSGDAACYQNGVLITSGNMVPGGGILDSSTTINVSNNNGSSDPNGAGAFPGSLSIMRLYSLDFTLSQVQQNYNATKTRFGL